MNTRNHIIDTAIIKIMSIPIQCGESEGQSNVGGKINHKAVRTTAKTAQTNVAR